MIARSFSYSIKVGRFLLSKQKDTTADYRKPLEQLKAEQSQRKAPVMSQPELQAAKQQALQKVIAKKTEKTNSGKKGSGKGFAKMRQKESKLNKKIQSSEAVNTGRAYTPQTELWQTRKKFKEDNVSEGPQELKWSSKNASILQKNPDNTHLTLLQNIQKILKASQGRKEDEVESLLNFVDKNFGEQQLEAAIGALIEHNSVEAQRVIEKCIQVKFNKESSAALRQQLPNITEKSIWDLLNHLASRDETSQIEFVLNSLQECSLEWSSKDASAEMEFFNVLFYHEINNGRQFLVGESGLLFGPDNRLLVQKIQITRRILNLTKFRKHKSHRDGMHQWLSTTFRVIQKYKFGLSEFKDLLDEILDNHPFLMPAWFYKSQQMLDMLGLLYFGKQKKLKEFLEKMEKVVGKVSKISKFFTKLKTLLMNYRIENGEPAFMIEQSIADAYEAAFASKSKEMAVICCLIASDGNYVDLSRHFIHYHVQAFKDEALSSEVSKLAEELVLDNYQSYRAEEKDTKLLQKLSKSGKNLFVKLTAMIKLGDNVKAYKTLEEDVLKNRAIERQSKNIEFVLRKNVTIDNRSYQETQVVSEFCKRLNPNFLWNLYERSQDASSLYKDMIPEDKFSFWEESEKKQRYQNLIKKVSDGSFEKIKQPVSDVQLEGYNLDQYLEGQFQSLKEEEEAEYQKEKELIKFKLRVEGLVEQNKVRNDNFISDKYFEIQSKLSPESLDVLESFGLKDYNIAEYGWEELESRFNNMRFYNNVAKDPELDFSDFKDYVSDKKKMMDHATIENILKKHPEEFQEAELLVKLPPQDIVEKLMIWGVYCNEPMAVYLAEKLAMVTGQQISDSVAVKVAHMLSYRRPLSEEFILKCKECLKVVGKIERELIYSFDRDYDHILVRKRFQRYLEHQKETKFKDSDWLDTLTAVQPKQQALHCSGKFLADSIARRTFESL